MRIITLGLCAGLVFGVCTAAAGQHRDRGRQTTIQQQAPTDRAVDFTLSALAASFKEMDAKQLSTIRLLEGGSYNVNIRRLRGDETSAMFHPKTTDVWVVREGSGTLVTGGTLVDAQGQPAKGASGAAIRGGVERVIKVGDVVFIPAGVNHGIKETKAITWLNIRFDTK